MIKVDSNLPHSYNPSMTRRLASIITIVLGCILIAIGCTSSDKTTSNINSTPVSVESQLASGAPIYARTCATSACHGTQGEGIRAADGFKVWPLVGEEFQSRHPNAQIVFDVIRSGGEPNLRALTDQQIYDSIAYEMAQNGIPLDSPLTAANAYSTFGGKMSGAAPGGLFPPSDNAVLLDLPLTTNLPIAAQNDQLGIQDDQIALASSIGHDQPPDGGAFLLLVIVFNDLNNEPTSVSPQHLRVSTADGQLLEPQPIDIQSAIEKFHERTIKRNHGTVGLVVFALAAPDDFNQLIYNDGAGDRIILALKP
jgi:hypothetical protein